MEYVWKRLTVDTLISDSFTLLSCVVITPSDTKKGDITIYNGESASDEHVIKIRTPSSASWELRFEPSLILDRGLYVDVGGDVEDVLVQYLIGKP